MTPPAPACRISAAGRHALAQGFLQTLQGDSETNGAAMAKTVSNGTCGAEHLDRHAISEMRFYIGARQYIRHLRKANRGGGWAA